MVDATLIWCENELVISETRPTEKDTYLIVSESKKKIVFSYGPNANIVARRTIDRKTKNITRSGLKTPTGLTIGIGYPVFQQTSFEDISTAELIDRGIVVEEEFILPKQQSPALKDSTVHSQEQIDTPQIKESEVTKGEFQPEKKDLEIMTDLVGELLDQGLTIIIRRKDGKLVITTSKKHDEFEITNGRLFHH